MPTKKPPKFKRQTMKRSVVVAFSKADKGCKLSLEAHTKQWGWNGEVEALAGLRQGPRYPPWSRGARTGSKHGTAFHKPAVKHADEILGRHLHSPDCFSKYMVS